MFIPFIRTIILYSFVIFAIRLMGKRQIGEMQPTELVVTILISAVASVPMQNLDIPLSYGVVPILTLISAEILISFLSLKIPRFKTLLTGKPVVLIENGIINQKLLSETRLSIDDLQEDLRLKDIFDLSEVKRAQLETNGQLSIMLKDSCKPLSFSSLNIKCPDKSIYFTIVTDGYINKDSLLKISSDKNWVLTEIKKHHVESLKDVFLMLSDKSLNTIVVKKEKK